MEHMLKRLKRWSEPLLGMFSLSHKDGGQDSFWACSACLRIMVDSYAYVSAWFPQNVLAEKFAVKVH